MTRTRNTGARSRLRALVASVVATALAASALVVVGATVAPAPVPASAAGANLVCDQNTLYGLSSASATPARTLYKIVLPSGGGTTATTTTEATLTAGSNALGISPSGTMAYAFETGGTRIDAYNPVTGATTTVTGAETANTAAIRGAVDPVNGYFYYAGSGTTSNLYAYDPATGTKYHQVGAITGLGGSNGDMAFGSDGTLYVVDGDDVFRVAASAVPTASGTTNIAATQIASLPTGTNSPGIAYSSDGYLYIASNGASSVIKLDPNNPTQITTITTGAPVVDLASCNYADTLRGKANVLGRASAGDQFTLTNGGSGISAGNTATTAGSATGVQAAIAGPNLTVAGRSYTVTQTAAGTTSLANYSVAWSCVDTTANRTIATGTGNTASFTYPTAAGQAGTDLVCTFTDAIASSAVNDSGTTPVNTPLVVSAGSGVLSNDSGSGLTAGSPSNPPHGSVALNADGSYTYTPDSGYSGPDSFSYVATDAAGGTSSAVVHLTVTPTAANDSGATGVDQALTLSNLTANDHGTGLAVTAVGTSSHGSATVSGGVVTYTPASGFSGTDTFSYTATDAAGQTATATVTVTVSPSAVDDYGTTTANTALVVPAASGLLTNDHPSNGTASKLTDPSHGSVSVNAAGSYTYTPAAGYSGPDSFRYTLTTPDNQTATATVHLTVTPVAVADTSSTRAGSPVTLSPAGNDRGSAVAVTALGTPAHGSVVLNGDGSVTYTPAAGFSGNDSFGYTITDASGQTTTSTVSVTVSPSAVPDTRTIASDAPATFGDLATNDLGTGIAITSVGSPTHGTVVLNGDGTVTFTPTAGYTGPASFSYQITDSLGRTSTATVTLSVTPTANDDSGTTPANTTLTVAAPGVLANDHATGGSVALLSGTTHGTVMLNADGSYVYTPTTGFSGNDSFTYTLTDASGSTDTATVHLTVTPTAAADSASTSAGTPVTLSALRSNDVGTAIAIASVGTPAHGTAVLNGNGTVTYTPAAGFSGDDSFPYTIADGSGRTDTATVAVTVTPVANSDAGTTAVNTPIAFANLRANDLGTSLNVSAVGAPSHGTATVAGNTVTYTPTTDYSGYDAFSYTVTDASGRTNTALVTVLVTPHAVDDATTTNANTPVVLSNLTGNDHGTNLAVTSVTSPSHGTATLSSGTVTYTPATDFSGTDTFGYTATDAGGQTSTAIVTVTVRPTAAADAATTPANTPVSPTLTGNDHGAGLTVTAVGTPTHGTATVSGGVVTYAPAADWSGTDTFGYTVTDTDGQTATSTVTVTVTPQAVDDAVGTAVDTPVTLSTLRSNDHGSTLSITAVGAASHGTVTRSGNVVTYTPAAGYTGHDSFTYTVTDASGQTDTATVHVTVSPVAVDDSATTAAGTAVTLPNLTSNDDGTGLAVTAVGTPAHGTSSVDGSGVVTYTPAAGYSGPDAFTYTATDSSGLTAPATVHVTVTPTATPDAFSTIANTAATPDLTSNDHGTALKVTSVTAPLHGTATVDASGAVTYKPTAGYSGPDSFGYTATDASGQVVSSTASVTVDPVAVADPSPRTVADGSALQLTDLTANDVGTGLTVTGVSTPTHGTAVLNSDGTVTYTPAPGFSGIDSFTYTVTDAAGGTSTAPVIVRVTPTAMPDACTVAAGSSTVFGDLTTNDLGSGLTVSSVTSPAHGSALIASGGVRYVPATGFSGTDSFDYTVTDSSGRTSSTTVTVTVTPVAVADAIGTDTSSAATVSLTANDLGSGLTITSVTSPAHGTVVNNGDGTVTYSPSAGYSGPDGFDYTVTDASGRPSTAHATVTVGPRATDDSATTPAQTPVTLANVVANDHGTGLALTGVGTPAHGTAVQNANGSITYTPAAGFSGDDSFTYTADDSTGQPITGTVNVVVTPVAADDTASTTAGTPVAIATLASNDTGSSLAVTAVGTPAHGSATVSGGIVTYTPAAGFSGDDQVQYTVRDGAGSTSTATLHIAVSPRAIDDTASVVAGSTLTLAAPGVLGNDLGTGLTATGTTAPAHGTVTVAANGAATYTPATGYSGADAFTYWVTDASGRTSTATVNVTVGVLVVASNQTATVSTPLTVLAADGLLKGAQGTGLQAAALTAPSHGTVVINPDGSYLYTPADGYTGQDTFTFTVTDANGLTAIGTATLTVVPRAAATDDTGRGKPGQPTTIDALANDRPTAGATFVLSSLRVWNGEVMAFELEAPSTDGTWTVSGGQLVFTPASGFAGIGSVRYEVIDTAGVTIQSTATVSYPALAATSVSALARTGLSGSALWALLALEALLLGLTLRFGAAIIARVRPSRRPAHRA